MAKPHHLPAFTPKQGKDKPTGGFCFLGNML